MELANRWLQRDKSIVLEARGAAIGIHHKLVSECESLTLGARWVTRTGLHSTVVEYTDVVVVGKAATWVPEAE